MRERDEGDGGGEQKCGSSACTRTSYLSLNPRYADAIPGLTHRDRDRTTLVRMLRRARIAFLNKILESLRQTHDDRAQPFAMSHDDSLAQGLCCSKASIAIPETTLHSFSGSSYKKLRSKQLELCERASENT